MLTIKLDHDKVNLVFGTDSHLSAVPPGRRADDYQRSVLEKFTYWSELTHKVKGVGIHGGDVFHHKQPKARGNTVGLIEATARACRAFPFEKLFGAVGNHDLSWDRMDTLPHQPLGILIAAGVYHNLVAESVVFTNADGTVKVLVESYPYMDEPQLLEALLASGPRPAGIDHRVGILHAYGHPNPPDAPFLHPIGYNDLQHLDYDFLCWGHDHSRKETMTVGNITHINFGSLARAALNDDEVDRPVCLGIMSFATDGIRYKEKAIPVKPLEVAFTTADKQVDRVAKSSAVVDFFAEMEDAVEGIEASDPREVLQQLCPPDEKPLLSLTLSLCEL